ncbi:STM4015 family protein [Streptomyces sp. NPDC018031]|uniref:STM4015 family protein n=1 Tax=Streptomyces sp. NPDC018031 TaxID=3365033 RepID=UPI0037B21866
MISDYLGSFGDLPVTDFLHCVENDPAALPAADAVAWRIAIDYDTERPFAEVWRQFLDTVAPEEVRALVIGAWWDDEYVPIQPVLDLLVAAAPRLPALRALFLADVTAEECEVSWLQMSDVTPVLEAFPELTEFVARGCGYNEPGENLALRPVRHERLRTLRLESGGLPGEVVRAVSASDLPALEYLELWLGVDQYGGDATVADLAPVLAGARLPALRRLGLMNSEIQDEIAAAVAAAPVVARLDVLDLSMGILTDTGAEALLAGQPLTHLSRLDLRHHYLSDAMMARLREALEPAGVEVELSGQEKPHTWEFRGEVRESRYVAVSE